MGSRESPRGRSCSRLRHFKGKEPRTGLVRLSFLGDGDRIDGRAKANSLAVRSSIPCVRTRDEGLADAGYVGIEERLYPFFSISLQYLSLAFFHLPVMSALLSISSWGRVYEIMAASSVDAIMQATGYLVSGDTQISPSNVEVRLSTTTVLLLADPRDIWPELSGPGSIKGTI